MKRQNQRSAEGSQTREYRDGARSRSTETRTYHMRRRSRRPAQAVMAYEDLRSPAQRFWDEHAIKLGMGMFWTWFIAANWSKFPAALSELAQPLLGS